jgi:hypothetical protein
MKYPTLMMLAITLVAAGLGAPAWAQDSAQAPPADTSSTTTQTPTDTGTGATAGTASSTSSATDSTTSAQNLPATATPLWLLGMLGGSGVMGFAVALRTLRFRRRA